MFATVRIKSFYCVQYMTWVISSVILLEKYFCHKFVFAAVLLTQPTYSGFVVWNSVGSLYITLLKYFGKL